jgi:hypothetical protein
MIQIIAREILLGSKGAESPLNEAIKTQEIKVGQFFDKPRSRNELRNYNGVFRPRDGKEIHNNVQW